jgi:protein-S-isoprenylcysteine O-methyltransferase Ste14
MTILEPTRVDIGAAQTTRKTLLMLMVATTGSLFVFCASRWSYHMRETIEWIGLGMILVCISGRTWCSLYIGGRKTSELVTVGPYSVSRNPLYLFSLLGAIGVGAQFGAVSAALLAGACAWMVHVPVVVQEERLLLGEHGDAYRRYLAAVPRFCPRLSRWRNVEVLQVRPRAVATTFFDACFFLAAVPVAAVLEYFQQHGYFRVLVWLP